MSTAPPVIAERMPDYVMARRPDLIFFGNFADHHPMYLSDRQLAADPLFRLIYEPREVGLPGPDGHRPGEIPDRSPDYVIYGRIGGARADGAGSPTGSARPVRTGTSKDDRGVGGSSVGGVL